ncbi:flagellar FliL protein [Gammaproteobacteria bacterium]
MSSEKAAAAPAAGGNTKMMIIFVVVGLVVVLGAVGATLYLTGFFSRPGSGGHESAEHSSSTGPKAEPNYLEIRPGFIVNTMDKGTTRFVQVGISVMSRNLEALDGVNELIFAVKNDLREVLSSRGFAEIIVSTGIEALRAESEAAVNKILKENHKPLIDALYFTTFVVQ